jgi:two-component system nitrate/nitrite response regulator NarL
MRDELRSLLERSGDIQVLAAVPDGRAAVDQAIQLDPDVAAMSMSIPVIGGIEATLAIVEKKPAIAVLLLSKDDPPSTIPQGFRAGARGYLLEASISSELVKAVRAIARGDRFLGSGVADRMFESFQASRSELDAVSRLSAMEREILRLAASGKSNAEMAEILGLSPRTVETYRAGLMHKLGLADVPSLVKFAIRRGIIPVD